MSINNIPEIEVSIKYKNKVKRSELALIKNSSDLVAVCKELLNSDTIDWLEQCILLCINRANKVIGYYKLSQGGLTGTFVDPRVIFTIALNAAGTCYLVLCHNHPSGSLTPSRQDDDITYNVKTAGSYLDIKLLDHIIISSEGYYSYSDEGRL